MPCQVRELQLAALGVLIAAPPRALLENVAKLVYLGQEISEREFLRETIALDP